MAFENWSRFGTIIVNIAEKGVNAHTVKLKFFSGELVMACYNSHVTSLWQTLSFVVNFE